MFYYLMHKKEIVARFFLDENDAFAKPKNIQINEKNEHYMPIGARMNNVKFIEWWNDRAIPKTRQGADDALKRLGLPSTMSALINNLALSLNDCYWIKPENEDFEWDEVNLYTNDFSDSFGELTFNKDYEIDLRKQTSFLRSVTTQGEVQKKWCIDSDKRRFLVKGNYDLSYQQSINEIFASSIHERQDRKDYTEYYFAKILLRDNVEGLGCYCYNYCNENIESISAWEMLQTVKIRMNESLYHPFKKACLDFGLSEEYFDGYMDYLILSDFLITNTDRHMNNISLLRDANSLKFIGFAPIYDSGNSMFFRIPTEGLFYAKPGQDKITSFITSKEVNMLKYVKNRKALNLDKVFTDFSVYEKDIEERRVRIEPMKRLFYRKMEMINEFQKGKDIWKNVKYLN